MEIRHADLQIELGQALNQHYRPAQPRFSDDSDQ